MVNIIGSLAEFERELYVYAKDEGTAAEIEDDFALLIADIASRILKQEIEMVVVLPKVLH